MTTQSVTLVLPEPVWQYLSRVATATQQPVEQIARQSLEGNLPPAIDDASAEMQPELQAMTLLAVEALRQIALGQMPPEQQARHLTLLERNATGQLPLNEQSELAELRLMADRLMVKKAYAWALVRWRGQPIPTLHELPLD